GFARASFVEEQHGEVDIDPQQDRGAPARLGLFARASQARTRTVDVVAARSYPGREPQPLGPLVVVLSRAEPRIRALQIASGLVGKAELDERFRARQRELDQPSIISEAVERTESLVVGGQRRGVPALKLRGASKVAQGGRRGGVQLDLASLLE